MKIIRTKPLNPTTRPADMPAILRDLFPVICMSSGIPAAQKLQACRHVGRVRPSTIPLN